LSGYKPRFVVGKTGLRLYVSRKIGRNQVLHLKALKLSLVAFLTLSVCVVSLYLIDREQFYFNYRCWRQAATLSSCFRQGHFDFVADLDGARYEGNTGNLVDGHIFFYGAHEKPILYFLRDTMKSAYSNQGIFLDIGANTGQHSLFMSKYAKEVHAFEPWEPVIKRFRRMVEINHIKNIVIHPFGLGDENSKKPFFRPPDNNLGTGSFVEGFKEDNSIEGELEIRTGDDALEEAGVTSVALIKMDIEGYEKLALKGLRRTLLAQRPIVEFELSADPKSPVSIKNKDELTALFPEKYEFLVFSDKDDPSTGTYFLQPISERVRFDKSEQYDMVAYPKEKEKSIFLKGPHP
jgi:FkbM family methyltransferase